MSRTGIAKCLLSLLLLIAAVAVPGASASVDAASNRVSIDTPNGRLSVDLEGKAHFEKTVGQQVPTPHVKIETDTSVRMAR